jgi:hypothetical protein
MAKGKRDLQVEGRWRSLLARQRTSGMTVRAFCAKERIAESAYYAWRREIGLRDREKTAGKAAFVPLVMPTGAAEAEGQIIIELRGERVLRLPAALPVERVVELVRAIEGAS